MKFLKDAVNSENPGEERVTNLYCGGEENPMDGLAPHFPRWPVTFPVLVYFPAAVLFFWFFLILVCEAIDTAATPGLLCQPRVIVKMIVEKQMECMLAGETEVLGENLPQRHFCPSQNPTWPDPVLNPGRRDGKPATNRLSYGAATAVLLVRLVVIAK
jgi:hypothetical protein